MNVRIRVAALVLLFAALPIAAPLGCWPNSPSRLHAGGSTSAIQPATQVDTPVPAAQRVDRLTAIARTFLPDIAGEPASADHVTISGVLRTEDGSPLPAGAKVAAIFRAPGYPIDSGCRYG